MTSTTAGAVSARPRERASRFFYLGIAITMVVAIFIGFGRTIDAGLIHPPSPRPWILHVHVALFSAWLVLFIAQIIFVGRRQMRLHRRLGYFSIGLASAMVVVGVATAIAMTRLHLAEGSGGLGDLPAPLFDMVAFTVLFALAVIYRFRPEYHRRFILMASCGLTSAAFGRFPHMIIPAPCFYIAVDLLIIAAVIRDLVNARRVHPVYAIGLPILALGQSFAMWLALASPPWWTAAARWMLD